MGFAPETSRCFQAAESLSWNGYPRTQSGNICPDCFGHNSQIARWSGLRKSWRHDQYVLCANEDIPYPPQDIERFYGSRFPLFVSLRFNGLDGYGWVFPKRE